MIMHKMVFGAALAAMMTLGGAASALTCGSGGSATDYFVDYTSSPGVEIAGQCGAGPNDSESRLDALFGAFWTLADKNDNGDGNQLITIEEPALANGTQKGGVWEISFIPPGLDVALVFKAGNNWAAYLLNEETGTFTMSKGLSHNSLYYRPANGGGVLPGVPVPASLPLLLTGLLGAGIVARRRRK